MTSRRRRHLLDRAVQPQFLHALDRAVERHPSHDLGVGEVPALAPHLPDARIGHTRPDGSQMLQQRPLERPPGLVDAQAAAPGLMQRVQQLAIDVELKLGVRGVADPDRTRALVSRQPRHLPLGEPPLSRQSVHDLHLLRGPGDSAQQPVSPAARLGGVARVEQRQQGPGRIAQPTEPIIPVAGAADPLRQRGGRRRDDAARRGVGQRLERDQRALHRTRPLAADAALRRPFAPKGLRSPRVPHGDRAVAEWRGGTAHSSA